MTLDVASICRALALELRRFGEEQTPPAEALARIAAVARAHEAHVELVWEREPLSGRYHYDALVDDGDGVLSLSHCGDDVTPWPLRGAHRWSEQDIVQVNGRVLNMSNVSGWLEAALWGETNASARLIDHCLVKEAVERRGLTATEDELDRALETFRGKRGLFTVAEYEAWLHHRGQAHADVVKDLELEVCAQKLKTLIAGDRAESYFAEHAREFDRVACLRCGPLDESEALALLAEIRAGRTTLSRYAAVRASLPGSRAAFVSFRRGELDPSLAEPLFAARAGELVGPLKAADRYDVIEVLEPIVARFSEVRAHVEHVLFDRWLDEQRRAADIRWFWGRRDEPSARGPGEDAAG
jgi:putative peptide maturation system protein